MQISIYMCNEEIMFGVVFFTAEREHSATDAYFTKCYALEVASTAAKHAKSSAV